MDSQAVYMIPELGKRYDKYAASNLWSKRIGITLGLVLVLLLCVVAFQFIGAQEVAIKPNIEQFVRAFYPWKVFKDFSPDHFVL
ncbi:hypothetical protein [Gilvibacter sp.]|uniref:hypothetical protein n=1 Tax=Gilvibacter sp. TaxID=2729997 RepID=UPI0025C2F476|nr:hypothetical protein [Gilvibacter sp.]NQX77513.1 hypothetical protein [Gilvibacter sp.]